MKTLLVLSLPAKPAWMAAALPVNPSPAPVSYTSEEIELWQALAAAGREMAAQVFTERTGKPHDPAFLL